MVLGIDAAWTQHEPSGIALIIDNGSGWALVEAAASYVAFLKSEKDPGPVARHRGSIPDARSLLAAATAKLEAPVDVVAVDMPLSMTPIVGRRASDNMISTLYGARHASTHTPSVTRPGKLSDELREGFERIGYPLTVNDPVSRALLEVYPHPALIELAAADRRLPYKQSKIRKYWPDVSPVARRANLLRTWSDIVGLLDVEISGVKDALPLPSPNARGYELKAYEDALDAVVCAWVGACALTGRARAYGDEESAIWVPVSLPS
ncbi:DUF429 domain-containing protein [Agrobacterium pusense]|uniref:DUF429 domain-containing protein n=1 Tax=Agrobacterium pusense TaxID=648995 RepID=UPI002E1968B5